MSADIFTLYYFPGSYYSHKALLAFFEKDVKFQRYLIDIYNGDQLEPWYMKLNPNGNVPTLKHGDKIITDSEDIIKYLDKVVPKGPSLLPDPASPVGKEVERWCKKLNDIQIENISFGVLRHPELSASGIKIPSIVSSLASPKVIKRRFDKATANILKYADKYPELKEAYLQKLEIRKGLYSGDGTTAEITVKILDDLELLFDQIEEQMKNTRKEQGTSNCWLVGPEFTAADIIMTIFLDRLNGAGLIERYISESNRPLIYDYFQRLGKKASVQKLRAQFSDIVLLRLGSTIKEAMPSILGMATVILAVGLGFYFWKQKSL